MTKRLRKMHMYNPPAPRGVHYRHVPDAVRDHRPYPRRPAAGRAYDLWTARLTTDLDHLEPLELAVAKPGG